MDSRDVVLDILMDIETKNTFSNVALSKALSKNQFEDKSARAFITRLSEGVMEYKITLDYVINQFSKTKINKCKPLIRCLLRMGVYQILYMDSVPDSAACNEAVKLAKKHGFGSLSGFVNGVLRSIARAKESIPMPNNETSVEYLSVKYSMPVWLCEKLKNDYPKEYMDILKASFLDRETAIRVNTCKITKEELKKLIADAGIEVRDGYYDEKALLVKGYDFVKKIPGYKQGFFSIQDESSMCAIRAAGIKKGDTVLDICAAPGGKTTCAAEYLMGEGTVYSMDLSKDKLELIEENVKRLGFDNVKISAHDGKIPLINSDLYGEEVALPKEELREFADVVIADLPCSGLGIIGRKNDIKYRLDEKQLEELVTLQRDILNNAKSYVKRGGTLLYSTCTINPKENQENLKWFLDENKAFTVINERLFIQGVDNCDGFYFVVMKKA